MHRGFERERERETALQGWTYGTSLGVYRIKFMPLVQLSRLHKSEKENGA